MSLCAAAAYSTITPDFAIDTLSAHFLAGPSPTSLVELHVDRLSDGGRFCTRVVKLTQGGGGGTMVHVTCSFVRTSLMGGRSMEHVVGRKTGCMLQGKGLELDDLAVGRTGGGPWMGFQRLGVFYTGSPILPPLHTLLSNIPKQVPDPNHKPPTPHN